MVVIPDMSGMDGQRPTAVFKNLEGREFRHESGVPTVGSSDTSNTLTQLQWFSNVLRVGSSDGRKFRHSSGVPTPHIVSVT